MIFDQAAFVQLLDEIIDGVADQRGTRLDLSLFVGAEAIVYLRFSEDH
jgi:hypothetical protein